MSELYRTDRPGPASTVEEHSLRKFCSRGDCGSNLAERTFLFSREYNLFAIKDWRQSPTIGRVTSYLATYRTKQLLRQSLLVKRNVALKIGPMTSHLREWNDVIYSTTQFYLIYNDTSNLWRYLYELNHTAETRDDWRAMPRARPSDGK